MNRVFSGYTDVFKDMHKYLFPVTIGVRIYIEPLSELSLLITCWGTWHILEGGLIVYLVVLLVDGTREWIISEVKEGAKI